MHTTGTETHLGHQCSDCDDVKVRIEATKIIWVCGDDLLATASCADHDVGVGNVGGTAGRE
ncbi:MAG TPA: hypothetical protein VN327_02165 [Pseudonocardiaceae bacterium]|jgi:ribosomal protein L37AE/L43A|nr:hypothetical protein [Pseudonocardiaceae bacterium]